jgi:hypothetical protein
MSSVIRGFRGVKLLKWKEYKKMSDENLELAYKVMGAFINSKDPKGYTKNTLVKTYEIEEELAAELAEAAYREWSEAYGA